MAGQFDKFIKILGNGAKPDRVVGTWKKNNAGIEPGTPVTMAIDAPDYTANVDPNGEVKQTPPKKISQRAARYASMRLGNVRSEGKLKRIDTSRAGVNSENPRPLPDLSDSVVQRGANPKYLAADVQRENEDRAARTEADKRKSGVIREDLTGESAFNASEESSGSTIRSINGVTYDMNEWKNGTGYVEKDRRRERPSASELQGATWAGSETRAGSQAEAQALSKGKEYKPATELSDYKPSKSEGDIASQKADENLLRGNRLYEQSEAEKKADKRTGPRRKPRKEKFDKPSEVIGSEAVTEVQGPEKQYVENDPEKMLGHLSDEDYNARAENADILSTTMREVQPEGPARPVVLGHVPVRAPGQAAKAVKPTVNAPGNVVPLRVMDTFGGQQVDRTQADEENKSLLENKVPATSTTVVDQNVRPASARSGKTPERMAVFAAIRNNYAASLAKENKTLTTVPEDVLETAKAIGRAHPNNLTEDYMSTPEFLGSEHVAKAKVAHAFNVHHLLGTDRDPLAKYLGKNKITAKSRLSYLYKFVDRNARGNPEVVPGEFETFRGHVVAGLSPQAALRALKKNLTTKVTIGGKSPTLAEPAPIAGVKTLSSEASRIVHASTTTNIMHQQEKARKRVMRNTNNEGAIPSIKDLKAAHTAGHIDEAEAMDLNPKLERLEKSTPKFTEISQAHAAGHITEEEGKELNPNWNKNVGQQFQGVGTPAAPDARFGRVNVRQIGEEATSAGMRDLNKREEINKATKVPKSDDSRSLLAGTEEAEQIPTNADTYSENMLDRLNRGPKKMDQIGDES